MKNILLSVDFSKNAQKVALHTAEVAQLSKARLIIFHAYYPVAAPDNEQEEDAFNERQVQKRLDKLARRLHKQTGISITRLMKPASHTNEALDVAKIVKADVAVVCDQALPCPQEICNTIYDGLPVLTVPTNLYFDAKAFQTSLAGQLQLLGYSSPPLLETI